MPLYMPLLLPDKAAAWMNCCQYSMTVPNSLLSLASGCSERLQVPLCLSYITEVIAEEFALNQSCVFDVLFPKVARVVQWMKSCSISYSKVEFPICTALSSLSKASTKFCMWPSSGILLKSMGVVPCFFEVWNFFGCTADCWTPVLRLSRPGAALTTLKPAQCIETF